MPSSDKRTYRSALLIIQLILEELMRAGTETGLNKSQLFKSLGLKTAVGEKYLEQLISADYVILDEESWGERVKHQLFITKKGQQRFSWFMQLSNELEI